MPKLEGGGGYIYVHHIPRRKQKGISVVAEKVDAKLKDKMCSQSV